MQLSGSQLKNLYVLNRLVCRGCAVFSNVGAAIRSKRSCGLPSNDNDLFTWHHADSDTHLPGCTVLYTTFPVPGVAHYKPPPAQLSAFSCALLPDQRIRSSSSMFGGELLIVSGGNRINFLSRKLYELFRSSPGEWYSPSTVLFYTATLSPSRPGVNPEREEGI